MRILLACDKFKGTLTAAEVHARLAPPLTSAGHAIDSVPIADGGDGTVAAAVSAGFAEHTAEVTGPLGRPVTAAWAESSGTGHSGTGSSGPGSPRTSIIEMAQASGLALVEPTAGSALDADSAGTGELVRIALDAGCTRIVLGVGGSATTDGGAGMLRALGVALLDSQGDPIPPGGRGLEALHRIDTTGLHPRLASGDAHVVLASDVENPLLGPTGAAAVYGPQKGAGPAEVERLDRALRRFAALADPEGNHAEASGAGAAGGMGFGAFAVLGAQSAPGADFVTDLVGFPRALAHADLVITGEGRFDAQTLSGKGPGAVIAAAAEAALPVHIVCGSSEFEPEAAAGLGLSGIHRMTEVADVATCMERPESVLDQLAVLVAERIGRASD